MFFKFAKKRLGQNFLVDKNIQRKIIASCAFKSSDVVLEIGSGYGQLSRLIAECVQELFAVEIDSQLCKALKESLKSYRNVKVLNRDILKLNLKKYLNKYGNRIIVVGNIPYYISSPIIGHLLKSKDKIKTIFITVQKEFAKRMAALPGSKDYGSFSCFVQYYANPKVLFYIKNNAFFPRPKVSSSFVRLDIKHLPGVEIKNQRLLFRVIRAAFNKRRKTLRNSLDGIISGKKLEAFLTKSGIDRNIRPEKLSLQDFANLVNSVGL